MANFWNSVNNFIEISIGCWPSGSSFMTANQFHRMQICKFKCVFSMPLPQLHGIIQSLLVRWVSFTAIILDTSELIPSVPWREKVSKKKTPKIMNRNSTVAYKFRPVIEYKETTTVNLDYSDIKFINQRLSKTEFLS